MSTLASTRSRTSTSTSTSTASQSHSHSQTRSQSGTQSQSETDEKGQAEQTQAQTVETETEAEAETPTPTAPFMPSWLERACDDVEYQRYAYSELADRERIREEARKVSRGVKSRTKSFLSTFTGNLFSSTSSSNGSGSDPNTGGESQSTSERLHGGHYDIRIGWTDKNMGENRYRDIIPFDRTRVTVSIDGHPEGRYLNANWVRELYGGMWWIASQAPLPNTAHAFLGLFVQKDTRPPPHLAPTGYNPTSMRDNESAKAPCRVRVAVQLTKSVEKGFTKADPYFPSRVGANYIIPAPAGTGAPGLKVTLEEQEQLPRECCTKSIVRVVECNALAGSEPHQYNRGRETVEETGEPVYFTHLLYTHWPDFGVPDGPEEKAGLLEFARLVEEINRAPPPHHPPNTPFHPYPPKTVNCSAGIGRTGAFLALTSLLRAHGMLLPGSTIHPEALHELTPSPLGPLPKDMEDDEVANEIDSMREQRPSMVQNPRQMALVYELLCAVYHESEARAQQQQQLEQEQARAVD